MTSAWLDTAPPQLEHPQLDGDWRADVAVIGGGIVGVTTALVLREAGARVVLLEANRIGHGVTGHTTAKVSSQHGMIYAKLQSTFGADGARAYGESNEAALAWIAARIDEDGIDCDFRRRAAYAYVSSKPEQAEKEAEAAAGAGLPAHYSETTPLPYDVAGAVRFDDQAEFHPHKYLLALAEQLDGDVCERTHAVGVDSDGGCRVKTPGGVVTADRVVVATHYPFLDRSLAFARVHPQRSYALLCRTGDSPPDGMFISGDSPTRSVRAVPLDGEELLLVGGEGHRTGTGGDSEERYRRLEAFAREYWDVTEIPYRWSAQDGSTLDGVPYVGRLTPWDDRILMATGFGKWGITGGTAAALVLADLVQGRENPWASLYDPYRIKPLAAAPRFIKENAEAGLRFVADRLTKPGRRTVDDLQPGDAGIVAHDGHKVAAYRDERGAVTAVSPTCTHLGCQVNWNRAERSWDCPCHGSRFAPDGSVLEGPAVHRLERRPLEHD